MQQIKAGTKNNFITNYLCCLLSSVNIVFFRLIKEVFYAKRGWNNFFDFDFN